MSPPDPHPPVDLDRRREAREALRWLARRLEWERRYRELRGDGPRSASKRVAS